MGPSKTHKNIRLSFNKVPNVLEVKNLLHNVIESYRAFFQSDTDKDKRLNEGLEQALRSSFPMSDPAGKILMEYCNYEYYGPKFSEMECIDAGISYVCNVKATFKLTTFAIDKVSKTKEVISTKQQTIDLVEVPMITDAGSFIINGVERAAIAQIHRSPGIMFTNSSKGSNNKDPEDNISARIALARGPWLDFEFDARGNLKIKIDKTKRIPVATLILSLYKDSEAYFDTNNWNEDNDNIFDNGYTVQEILSEFYHINKFKFLNDELLSIKLDEKYFLNKKFEFDLKNKNGKVVAPSGTRLTLGILRKLQKDNDELTIDYNSLIGKYVAKDYVNKNTGIIEAEAGETLTLELLNSIISGYKEIELLDIDSINVSYCIRNAICKYDVFDRKSAIIELYTTIKGVKPLSIKDAEVFIYKTFFDASHCNMSEVGRLKINHRLSLKETRLSYTSNDIIATLKYLMKLKNSDGYFDDIDSLYTRRVRFISEILENIYRNGISRSYKYIRDRSASIDLELTTPSELLNFKPLNNSIRDFFHSSSLSQFLDNTNPLTSLTHKRRISALGPGGILRERASFEIRDVHPTHYGRICPIETPEGQSIGLINSLTSHATVDSYGFLEAPYIAVKNGKLTNEIVRFSCFEEHGRVIAGFIRDIDKEGNILSEQVSARVNGEYKVVHKNAIEFIDASSNQIVSIAASLIPFIENDDANRALMGSNMQRQAVPLINPHAPLVGTGMEYYAAVSSCEIIIAKCDGIVESVDSSRIVVSSIDENGGSSIHIYDLKKFRSSNQSTCINQIPAVHLGKHVKKGDPLTQGSGIQGSELALGKNVLCAFLSWNGYNFEDSVVISEKLVRDNTFTSVHIEEFEAIALDTRFGPEEITRDIPNYMGNLLDEGGIVTPGSYVMPGDILVGKITPRASESSSIAEERLLRAMFGEKARSVKDTSLRVPTGVQGYIIDVKVISCSNSETDYRSYMVHEQMLEKVRVTFEANKEIVERSFKGLIIDRILSHTSKSKEELVSMSLNDIVSIKINDHKTAEYVRNTYNKYNETIDKLKINFKDQNEKLKRGIELQPNVLKIIKVSIAIKRRLQPGDKISGRHGNKGVISKVAAVEDMPHLEDGTPVDVILNTLGVPSRMNIGQILEVHMGWAAKKLGEKISKMMPKKYDKTEVQKQRIIIMNLLEFVFSDENLEPVKVLSDQQFYQFCLDAYQGLFIATPVFDGANDQDINNMMEAAGVTAQVPLIDGITGEYFDRPTTVGYSYLLKLDHLVDDKIHARSVGHYSLVTQQPLGGRAQFGGQRFGEMEVWALQAYGAAYTLHEMLTIKSDDSAGRILAYDNIIRGHGTFISHMPESFNVLMCELQALGINIELLYDNTKSENLDE